MPWHGFRNITGADTVDASYMESYYRTYNTEDGDALASYYHPEVELTSAAGVMKGVDAVLATYRQIVSVFHDKMTPTRIDVDGQTAVVYISDCFTAKTAVDDFLGMKVAAGDSFELKLRGVYTFGPDKLFRTIVIEQLSADPP